MAKKKAELETDTKRYYAQVEEMRKAHKRGDYERAVGFAASAWDNVDGMIQFERRFENRSERNSLPCVDYALLYAPLLFDVQTLDTLSILLRTQKRVDKDTVADLAARLDGAYTLMKEAHRLWDHLERHERAEQAALRNELGGEQERWRWLAEKWESMGLVKRFPNRGSYLLSLSTRMESKVKAKCFACGVIAKAPKARFWEKNTCPKCNSVVYFVIIAPDKS